MLGGGHACLFLSFCLNFVFLGVGVWTWLLFLLLHLSEDNAHELIILSTITC